MIWTWKFVMARRVRMSCGRARRRRWRLRDVSWGEGLDFCDWFLDGVLGFDCSSEVGMVLWLRRAHVDDASMRYSIGDARRNRGRFESVQ